MEDRERNEVNLGTEREAETVAEEAEAVGAGITMEVVKAVEGVMAVRTLMKR